MHSKLKWYIIACCNIKINIKEHEILLLVITNNIKIKNWVYMPIIMSLLTLTINVYILILYIYIYIYTYLCYKN